MTFLTPLGLLGLIGVPILILIYVLKRRYRDETVPSTFLWRRSLAYRKRQLPFNLRNSLLLILQLLAIVLVSFILARPTVPAGKSGEVIAILDASASMSAKDSAGQTRFARACEQIADLAEKADGNHRVTVIVAGAEASCAVYRSESASEIRAAVADAVCGTADSDMEGALALAKDVQMENTRAVIRLFTDTRYEVSEGVTVTDVTHGEWNSSALGLTATSSGGVIRFTGKVASYGEDASLTVSLYVDGEFVSVKKVNCTSGTPVDVEFRDYEATSYTYAEMIVTCSAYAEAIEEDNAYTLYQDASIGKKILLVKAPDYRDAFLYTALRATGRATVKNVQLTSSDVDENGYEAFGTGKGGRVDYRGYDIYIFAGVLPALMPTDGAVWLIDPPEIPSEFPLSVGEEVTAIEGQQKNLAASLLSDPEYAAIVSGLTLDRISVNRYLPLLFDPSSGFRSLLTCDGDTVVAAGKLGFTRTVVWTLKDSNFAVNLSDYPLFVRNLVDYSMPSVLDAVYYPVGTSCNILMPAGATKAEILRDGDPVYAWDASDAAYTFAREGDYEIRVTATRLSKSGIEEDTTLSYYCYVGLDEGESNIWRVEEEITPLALPEGHETEPEQVEIWQYFLIALLLILMAEWWVYYRV